MKLVSMKLEPQKHKSSTRKKASIISVPKSLSDTSTAVLVPGDIILPFSMEESEISMIFAIHSHEDSVQMYISKQSQQKAQGQTCSQLVLKSSYSSDFKTMLRNTLDHLKQSFLLREIQAVDSEGLRNIIPLQRPSEPYFLSIKIAFDKSVNLYCIKSFIYSKQMIQLVYSSEIAPQLISLFNPLPLDVYQIYQYISLSMFFNQDSLSKPFRNRLRTFDCYQVYGLYEIKVQNMPPIYNFGDWEFQINIIFCPDKSSLAQLQRLREEDRSMGLEMDLKLNEPGMGSTFPYIYSNQQQQSFIKKL